nr:ATP-dependent DNA helicase Q1 [Ciona intestinalis]|eukprot:XP_018669737.1 ATP-dependent DNA helicase Q1 [Ciona intestinalis]
MAALKDLDAELSQVTASLNKIQTELQALLHKQENLQERKSQLESEINRRRSCSSSKDEEVTNWSSEDFPWSKSVRSILKSTFRMDDFRSKQLEAINATLSGRDVILIMSTGGGKSLTYQLPALVGKGITVVISPLVSLMEDQIISLNRFGIEAKLLNAASTKDEVKHVHQSMTSQSPSFRLLYVTPEKISKSKRFMAQLEKCYKSVNLNRIAIDEVHCASQWGNDFRPDYKILGILKRQFPKSPIIGLTATSTDKVTEDTKKMLNIPFALVFKTALDRRNLFYQVREKPNTNDDVIKDIVQLINSNFKNQPGIIYCFSRKNCAEVASSLNKRGIKSSEYHAQLTPDDKTKVHHMWSDNNIQVICATIAFGMGIDKPNVRFVIHHSMSKSVENYYQESGRAGRDGSPALCLLYFGFTDVFKQSTMVMTERTGLDNLNQMIKYCLDVKSCRRNLISTYFGEAWSSISCHEMCDTCSGMHKYKNCDVTSACQSLISTIRLAESKGDGNRLTGSKVVEAAAGRGKNKSLDLKSFTASEIQRILLHMLHMEYIREDFHFTPYSTISYLVPGPMATMLTNGLVTVMLDMPVSGGKTNDQVYTKALKGTGKSLKPNICNGESSKLNKRKLNTDVSVKSETKFKVAKISAASETILIDSD